MYLFFRDWWRGKKGATKKNSNASIYVARKKGERRSGLHVQAEAIGIRDLPNGVAAMFNIVLSIPKIELQSSDTKETFFHQNDLVSICLAVYV